MDPKNGGAFLDLDFFDQQFASNHDVSSVFSG
jgi:hypothetical protein